LKIIPVIDLLNNCVVHAKRGDRQHYQPIQSTLCDSSEPLTIVSALLELYPFKQLYIADLAAIQGTGNHSKIIQRIAQHYPELEIWLDAGYQDSTCLPALDNTHIRPALGSESLSDLAAYLAIQAQINHRGILSLDFTQAGYQGPQALIADSQYWPGDVIAMTLPAVGSNTGPDMKTLHHIQQISRNHHILAAGGIRHWRDIATLRDMGIKGVLIASALHAGLISSSELASLEA
jgi:phosphoribosylformimino-5-aminoimidazole carboxamide ribotide isomerase